VKISASVRQLDPFRPWTNGAAHDVTGSGVVIGGKRILTNAHVVNHASQVFIQPDKSSEKLSGKVEILAPGIDLALIKLDDESFFDAHPALPASSKIPALQQTIFVYGYPEGGSELSITRGIVSRLEFAEYYLLTRGLRVQVDAAVNPGNSGGPAVADGQLIGIAFSKLQQSDNIGYIIPMEEINQFLADVKDGRYDGKPVLEIDVQKLENDALRARFKLDRKSKGILVRKIRVPDDACPLKVDDIITKVGDNDVDNAGMVTALGDRLIDFQFLVQRFTRDGRLPMTVLRDGKEKKLEVPVKPAADTLFSHLSVSPPSYFIFGPLVLTEASGEFIRYLTSYGGSGDAAPSGGNFLGLLYSANPLFTRYGDKPSFAGERIVIIGHPLFSHQMSKGYDIRYAASIDRVNGTRVRNLKHLVEIIRDATGEFIEFTFHGNDADMLVFNRAEAIEATEQILIDNSIRQQFSADIAPIWKRK
jgi:S1-C subfamily serine protease